MDRPEGVGTSATYNYRHFLQLLAIKIRQREGQNLEAIRAELRETTGDALERRVAQWMSQTLSNSVPSVAQSDGDGLNSWRRVAIADGVELHVRDDSLAARESSIIAMREALRSALGRVDPE